MKNATAGTGRIVKVLLLLLLVTFTASASQITFSFTTQQIINALAAQSASFNPSSAGIYDFWATPQLGNSSGQLPVTINGVTASGSQSPVPQASNAWDYYAMTVPDSNAYSTGTNWAHFYVQQSNDFVGDPNHTQVLFATNYSGSGPNRLSAHSYAEGLTAAAPMHSMIGGNLAPNDVFTIAVDTGNNYVATGTAIHFTWTVAYLNFNPGTGAQTTKANSGTFTLDGIATAPEPATISMIFAGLFLIGFKVAKSKRSTPADEL